jgi:hypothetical protein
VWNVWGKEFHLKRLLESFIQLRTLSGVNVHASRESFDEAISASEKVMELLLKEAESLPSNEDPGSPDDRFFTVMVTLLWQPEGGCIKVLGHAFSALKATSALDYKPDPLLVSIAFSPDRQETLPNRFESLPGAKLSSWCRRRRPLEQEFKKGGADEVLLTRVDGDEVFLLEGLTSNLFAVYPGGILRTPATDCVLEGYSRQLVLEEAQRCGLKVEIGPLRLEDSSLWEELFLTSSVRLIIPVQKLDLASKVTEGSSQGGVVWSMKRERDELLWKRIYDELFTRHS